MRFLRSRLEYGNVSHLPPFGVHEEKDIVKGMDYCLKREGCHGLYHTYKTEETSQVPERETDEADQLFLGPLSSRITHDGRFHTCQQVERMRQYQTRSSKHRTEHREMGYSLLSKGVHDGPNGSRLRAFVELHETERVWPMYRLFKGRTRAFINLFNELGRQISDWSRRFVVAYGGGHAVPRNDCTPAPSTRA